MRLIKRRDFVASLGLGAGAFLLGPVVREWIAEAHADDLPPVRRLLLIQDGQGWDPYRYTPTGSDLAVAELNPAMEPLSPFKERMLILDAFYNPYNVGLHGNGHALLTMRPSPLENAEGVDSTEKYPKTNGLSIDRAIAQSISNDMPFLSLNFSIQGGLRSSDGPEQQYPTYNNPVEAYAQLFGGFDPSQQEEAKKRLLQRRKSLDLVVDDIKRLEGRLAGPEREKLDQYLSSIEQIDERMQKLANSVLTCTPPPALDPELDRTQKKYDALDLELMDTLVDLAVASLLCSRTRVVGLQITPSRANYVHLQIDRDKHDTQHEALKDGESAEAAQGELTAIDVWHTGIMASILQRLGEVQEGTGTVLDNTLTMWINEGGGRHHTNGSGVGGLDRHPVVLIGDPLGRLGGLGRFVQYPVGERSLADVYVTVANALDVEMTSFGEPEHNHGPLPGLA